MRRSDAKRVAITTLSFASLLLIAIAVWYATERCSLRPSRYPYASHFSPVFTCQLGTTIMLSFAVIPFAAISAWFFKDIDWKLRTFNFVTCVLPGAALLLAWIAAGLKVF
jgi:hypothetical protein